MAITGRGTLDGLAQYEFTTMRGVDPEITREIEIARAAGVDMRRYYRVGVQTYMCILNNCRHVHLRAERGWGRRILGGQNGCGDEDREKGDCGAPIGQSHDELLHEAMAGPISLAH